MINMNILTWTDERNWFNLMIIHVFTHSNNLICQLNSLTFSQTLKSVEES